MRNPCGTALLLLVTIGGCDLPTRPTEQAQREDATSVQTLYGEVVLTRAPGTGNVVMTLDGGRAPNQSDGTADFVFVLQREGFAEPAFFHQLTDAVVRATPEGVLVTGVDGFSAGLFLGERFTEARQTLIRGEGMPGQIWIGHGFARRTGTWEVPRPDQPERIASLLSCSREAGAAGPLRSFSVCHSGGAGATKCGTTCGGGNECDVSCTKGFYACCDKVLCNCNCVRVSIEG